MRRVDGRSDAAVRTMSASLGLLARSDGSAKFQFGKTGVLASVYGPMQGKVRDEMVEKASIQINYTPVSGTGSPQDRLYERILKELANQLILTSEYPRTLIKITCQAMSDDGSILSTATNAMMMALIDAGISMNSSCTGVTCMIHNDGTLLLDPIELELCDAQSIHVFAFDATTAKCAGFHSTGLYTQEEVRNFDLVRFLL
jgi:exosome complex component RRP46